VNNTHLRTSSPVVSYQYSPADVTIFQYSSEIVLEILQNKKMTEAMMTEKHVETSAEEITHPSKMDKNVLLSRSQNWYVGVVLCEKCAGIQRRLSLQPWAWVSRYTNGTPHPGASRHPRLSLREQTSTLAGYPRLD